MVNLQLRYLEQGYRLRIFLFLSISLFACLCIHSFQSILPPPPVSFSLSLTPPFVPLLLSIQVWTNVQNDRFDRRWIGFNEFPFTTVYRESWPLSWRNSPPLPQKPNTPGKFRRKILIKEARPKNGETNLSTVFLSLFSLLSPLSSFFLSSPPPVGLEIGIIALIRRIRLLLTCRRSHLLIVYIIRTDSRSV